MQEVFKNEGLTQFFVGTVEAEPTCEDVIAAASAAGYKKAVLAPFMVGYICSAATNFLIAFADDQSIVNLHNWSLGSFSGSSWNDIAVIAVVVITVSACVFAISKPLSAFQLGEAYAKSVGVNVARFRVVLVLLASMLSACVTAFAGPVSFVGIAVPHLVKSALKSSKPIRVIPACFLGGAIFCAGCDLIARTLFSPVGFPSAPSPPSSARRWLSRSC